MAFSIPENYNPPVNYCIYYECSRMDKEYIDLNGNDIKEYHSMTKDFVKDIAVIAKSLHCNLIYLDQGWDTHFGSLIWDEERLGPATVLVSEMQKEGLEIGILVELHSSEESFDDGIYIRGENGEIIQGDPWHKAGICVCSNEYPEIRLQKIKKLSDAGISFFSYDFHNYTPCYSKEHNHSLPSTPYEHALGLAKIQAQVKEACKNTLIESHDWLDCGIYYFPVYMFGNGHHERWGFEYMWDPLNDYKSGRLQNLYYYNLAYELPLYLHMNLTGIGENAEVFWYFASTIRHFGMGNFTELLPNKQELVIRACSIYNILHDYFALGEFKGKGPLAHIHVLNDKGAVVTIFNDGTESYNEVILTKSDVDIQKISKYKVLWGKASVIISNGIITITTNMLCSDAVVIELKY